MTHTLVMIYTLIMTHTLVMIYTLIMTQTLVMIYTLIMIHTLVNIGNINNSQHFPLDDHSQRKCLVKTLPRKNLVG